MLPNIPNDSLFKFLAVGGMLLAGATFWYQVDCKDRLRAANITLKGQYIEYFDEVESSLHRHSIENPKVQRVVPVVIVNTETEVNVRLAPGVDYTFLHNRERRETFKKFVALWHSWLLGQEKQICPLAFTPAAYELATKLRALATNAEGLWQQYDDSIVNCEAADFGFYVGIGMCIIGFGFWIRNQRRSDAMEKYELRIAKKEYRDMIEKHILIRDAHLLHDQGSGI